MDDNRNEIKRIRLLASSDVHGKMTPTNYLAARFDPAGSLAQLATAISELRDDHTVVIDAGDSIQDNSADLFMDDPVHPMILGQNAIGYDYWIIGNHDIDYGMEKLRQVMETQKAAVLACNVYDEKGTRIARPYDIIEVDGIRLGFIGMTSPVIADTDIIRKAGYTVTDPIEETRKIISEIRGQTDALVAITHMGVVPNISKKDTGTYELAEACPELDVIISAHEHKLIEGEIHNGVLIVENLDMGQSLIEVQLEFECGGQGRKLTGKSAKAILMKDYSPDAQLLSLFSPFEVRAIEDAQSPVGTIVRKAVDHLVYYRNEVTGEKVTYEPTDDAPYALVMDSDILSFISEVLLYYSGAEIAATNFPGGRLPELSVHMLKKEICSFVKYPNYLCVLRMSGKQLRRYMEWSAAYFKTISTPGEPVASAGERISAYYDIFSGVEYKIDLAREPYDRIRDLRVNGVPVRDDDSFKVAVTDFRCNFLLLNDDGLFEGEEKPELVQKNVGIEIGNTQALLLDYVVHVLKGGIRLENIHNWEIVWGGRPSEES